MATPRIAGTALASRRQIILAAAGKRFAERGFETTTVRQIADDVDILSGSLYHHFATKEDMLHDILREPLDRLRQRVLRIAALPADAETRLVTLILAELAELTSNNDAHAILYGERNFFRRNPDFAYVVAAKKETYLAWRAILEDGLRAGLFAADTDVYLTISNVIRMLTTGAGWFIHEDGSVLEVMGHYTLESLAEFYLTIILRSIRAPERAGLPVPAPIAE
jgi:AcrR family transcriptional regulator